MDQFCGEKLPGEDFREDPLRNQAFAEEVFRGEKPLRGLCGAHSVPLGIFWCRLGSMCGSIGIIWGSGGEDWGLCGAHWESCGAIGDHVRPIGDHVNPIADHVGIIWG